MEAGVTESLIIYDPSRVTFSVVNNSLFAPAWPYFPSSARPAEPNKDLKGELVR